VQKIQSYLPDEIVGEVELSQNWVVKIQATAAPQFVEAQVEELQSTVAAEAYFVWKCQSVLKDALSFSAVVVWLMVFQISYYWPR